MTSAAPWQSLNQFPRGHKRDPHGHRRTSFRMLAAGLARAPHRGADLRQYAPPAFDQGQIGSCGGHAYACAVTTALAIAGYPLDFVASPRIFYALARCIDRAPSADGTLPALTDEGSEPNALQRAANEWGVCAMGPTVEGRFSDCGPDNVNAEPLLGELVTASTHVLIGEYAIDTMGEAALADACATALDNGIPIPFSVPGGSDAWQLYTGTSAIGLVPAAQSELDHEVVILGYRVAADGSLEFCVRNSWSESYGDAGNIWITTAALAQCGDHVAMKVRPA